MANTVSAGFLIPTSATKLQNSPFLKTISANIPANTRLCIWVFAGIFSDMRLDPLKNLVLTSDLLRLVGEIDEFKGAWKAFGNLAPDRLATLRRVATVESVGAST